MVKDGGRRILGRDGGDGKRRLPPPLKVPLWGDERKNRCYRYTPFEPHRSWYVAKALGISFKTQSEATFFAAQSKRNPVLGRFVRRLPREVDALISDQCGNVLTKVTIDKNSIPSVKYSHIRVTSRNYRVLDVDLDYYTVFDVLYRDPDIPMPAMVVVNMKGSRYCHLVYEFRGVDTREIDRLMSLLCFRLKADRQVVFLRNPFSHNHTTYCLTKPGGKGAALTKKEVRQCIKQLKHLTPPRQKIRPGKQVGELLAELENGQRRITQGTRNCTLFDLGRYYAYHLVAADHTITQDELFRRVNDYMASINVAYCTPPLTSAEVGGIARSIARWVMKNAAHFRRKRSRRKRYGSGATAKAGTPTATGEVPTPTEASTSTTGEVPTPAPTEGSRKKKRKSKGRVRAAKATNRARRAETYRRILSVLRKMHPAGLAMLVDIAGDALRHIKSGKRRWGQRALARFMKMCIRFELYVEYIFKKAIELLKAKSRPASDAKGEIQSSQPAAVTISREEIVRFVQSVLEELGRTPMLSVAPT